MNKELSWWQGDGGNAYMYRNSYTPQNVDRRALSFQRIQRHMIPAPSAILEVGAGPGENLLALQNSSTANLYAIEPNESARVALEQLFGSDRIFDGHAEAIPSPDNTFDLVFTAGVLIHIAPPRVPYAMREMVRVSKRYVLAIEYFSPQAEPVVYYGDERIWRNDFGKIYLAQGLEQVAHGFFWKEAGEGFDNTVWWLMKKPEEWKP